MNFQHQHMYEPVYLLAWYVCVQSCHWKSSLHLHSTSAQAQASTHDQRPDEPDKERKLSPARSKCYLKLLNIFENKLKESKLVALKARLFRHILIQWKVYPENVNTNPDMFCDENARYTIPNIKWSISYYVQLLGYAITPTCDKNPNLWNHWSPSNCDHEN